jgi:hypothetical protein
MRFPNDVSAVHSIQQTGALANRSRERDEKRRLADSADAVHDDDAATLVSKDRSSFRSVPAAETLRRRRRELLREDRGRRRRRSAIELLHRPGFRGRVVSHVEDTLVQVRRPRAMRA